jgi:hypothetical protein
MESKLQLQKPPVLAIALISGAALAYEILLMRLLSIIHWHHFAYMIISVALLGYGASGTFLAISRKRLAGRYGTVFIVNAASCWPSLCPSMRWKPCGTLSSRCGFCSFTCCCSSPFSAPQTAFA